MTSRSHIAAALNCLPAMLGAAVLFGMLTLWPLSNLAAEEAPPASLEVEEPPLQASDRDHWSWRPLVRPAVPAVQQVDWCRTEIDRFILARLEAAGLSPLPPA